MQTCSRQRMSACVAILVLLALPAAASAAPGDDADPGLAWDPSQLLHELVIWLGGWLDGLPVQSARAPGGPGIDTDDSESPAPEAQDTATTDGGAAVDPNG